eukprot:TRINITY_DN68551_c0_g1_i1.p1 TRINITY_DN68551_c0_g1~~TRINITY_DN68551_c0_g1_i1.p1  ORF type:complete len:463 (+),score=157.92 TRINITY_DN68551_c0_g1_i1:3-1391(+)
MLRTAVFAACFALIVQFIDHRLLKWSTPAPPTRDDTQVACNNDFSAACPKGWTLQPPTLAIKPARPGEGVCEYVDGTRIRCHAPSDYNGPCRHIETPPCDVSDRLTLWTQICRVEWPSDLYPVCSWRKCDPPKCDFTTPPSSEDSCSTGFFTVVMQLPSRLSKFSVRRRVEFMETLYCNLRHPSVKEVHLMSETQRLPNASADVLADMLVTDGQDCSGAPVDAAWLTRYRMDPCNKLRHVRHGKRLTYHGAMEYLTKKEGLFLVTNSDIAVGDGFDKEHVEQVFSQMPNLAIPLTRYENPGCLNPKNPTGAETLCDCRTTSGKCLDSYFMQAPLPESIISRKPTPSGVPTDLDFPFGAVQGGENVFVENLVFHGMALQNRCGTMKVHHKHCTHERTGKSYTRYLGRERLPVGPLSFRQRLMVAIGLTDNWEHKWRTIPPWREGETLHNPYATRQLHHKDMAL